MAADGAGSTAEVVGAEALAGHELCQVGALESELAVQDVGAIPVKGGIGPQGVGEVELHGVGVVPGAKLLSAAQIDHAGSGRNLRSLQFVQTGVVGIEGAKVTLVRTDRRRLKEFETTTDGLGRARFPHLQAGKWQVTVERPKFRRVDRQITLQADTGPQLQRFVLKRSGW